VMAMHVGIDFDVLSKPMTVQGMCMEGILTIEIRSWLSLFNK
jgi:hypothetical protein